MTLAAVEIVTIVEEVAGHHFPVAFITSAQPLEEFRATNGFTWEEWFRRMGWKSQNDIDVPPLTDRWQISITGNAILIHDRKATRPTTFTRPPEPWVQAAIATATAMCFVVTDDTGLHIADDGCYTTDNCIGALVRVRVEPAATVEP